MKQNGLSKLATLSYLFVIQAQAEPLLLILNKANTTLSVIDATTLKIEAQLPSGPDPHEIIASADGRSAYISNYTRGNGAANTLSVVDLANLRPLSPIDLGALARPHGLTLVGGKIYFTAEGSKAIGRYDAVSSKIDWVMGTGQNRTHMVIVSNNQKQIFTSNVASATVSVLDEIESRGPSGPGPGPRSGFGGPGGGAPDWNTTVIPVGRGAEGFDLAPDEKELWAANAEDGTVSIIEVGRKTVIQTLPVPFKRANRLKFSVDGKHVMISDLGANYLFVIDAASRAILTKLDLGGTAAGLLMDPDGSRAFVSVGSKNSVAVIDLRTLKIVQRIESGPNPDGLAWAIRK